MLTSVALTFLKRANAANGQKVGVEEFLCVRVMCNVLFLLGRHTTRHENYFLLNFCVAAGRTFLLDVNVSHLSMSEFQSNARISLFKWDFELGEPHADTAHFLRAQTRRPETADAPPSPHSSHLAPS